MPEWIEIFRSCRGVFSKTDEQNGPTETDFRHESAKLLIIEVPKSRNPSKSFLFYATRIHASCISTKVLCRSYQKQDKTEICHIQALDVRRVRYDALRQALHSARWWSRPIADWPLQCDETRPVCRRCTKSGRLCVEAGAAKQAHFSIHLENRYVSGETKRPRGPRSALNVYRPHIDLQTRALAYFLQQHLQTVKDVSNAPGGWCGLTECLVAWNTSGRTSVMVDLALSSMSLAVFSNTQQYPPAATAASAKYCRLLRLAQKEIAQVGPSTLDNVDIDACLLAGIIMGRYEGVTSSPKIDSERSVELLHSWSHHDGAMAILKLWNDNVGNKNATTIMKQSRRGVIKSCLIRNLPIPNWMLNGGRFGETDQDLKFDEINVRMVNLRYALIKVQQEKNLQGTEIEILSQEVRELDEAVRNWAGQVANNSCFERHVVSFSLDLPYFYSPTVYSYPTLEYAVVWCQLFATSMLVTSMRRKVVEMSGSMSCALEHERLECIRQVNTMADHLAATIPFCLERLKVTPSSTPARPCSIHLNTGEEIKPHLATLMVWPLSIASKIDGLEDSQLQWFRSELATIGRIIGDGVLQLAETDRWESFWGDCTTN